MANMKQIYLVQFEEYSDGFCAFESYGNAYDFAYGLNWSGRISDARTEKYSVTR